MSNSILITGVAGHIGSRFSNWVINNHPDYKIVGIDSLLCGYEENVNKNIEFYKKDLSKSNIHEIFAKHKFKYVFHFAAYAAEGISPFLRKFVLSNNVLSTANILNECINFGVKRLVFTSSMSVYGRGVETGRRFCEDDVPTPLDPYAISKYTSELDIHSAGMQHGLDWCILRPHNIYGPGQNIWDRYRNVFGIWMYQVINNKPISIFGDGSQTRAFSYIDDCMSCMWNAAVSIAASKQIINIGGKKEYSIYEAANLFMNITGYTMVAHLEPRFEVHWSVPSWEKSVKILSYQDITPIDDGLKLMWEWAKKQPTRERKTWTKFEVEKGLYEYWKRQL